DRQCLAAGAGAGAGLDSRQLLRVGRGLDPGDPGDRAAATSGNGADAAATVQTSEHRGTGAGGALGRAERGGGDRGAGDGGGREWGSGVDADPATVLRRSGSGEASLESVGAVAEPGALGGRAAATSGSGA